MFLNRSGEGALALLTPHLDFLPRSITRSGQYPARDLNARMIVLYLRTFIATQVLTKKSVLIPLVCCCIDAVRAWNGFYRFPFLFLI